MRDDVVGELGVGGHTVVRGWAWPGAVNQEILPNQRQVRPLRPIIPTAVSVEWPGRGDVYDALHRGTLRQTTGLTAAVDG